MVEFRWLKSLNITLASEGKQRTLVKDVVGDNFRAESGAFTFSSGRGSLTEIREVPFVYVPNLIAKVADMIVSYQRYQKSTVNNYHLIL